MEPPPPAAASARSAPLLSPAGEPADGGAGAASRLRLALAAPAPTLALEEEAGAADAAAAAIAAGGDAAAATGAAEEVSAVSAAAAALRALRAAIASIAFACPTCVSWRGRVMDVSWTHSAGLDRLLPLLLSEGASSPRPRHTPAASRPSLGRVSHLLHVEARLLLRLRQLRAHPVLRCPRLVRLRRRAATASACPSLYLPVSPHISPKVRTAASATCPSPYPRISQYLPVGAGSDRVRRGASRGQGRGVLCVCVCV